ncbi:MAG: putative ABC transporter permease [Oscillospiraceae bacterium]|nr:putative ABC transporter permease [Oscillospiraceae bacterium]
MELFWYFVVYSFLGFLLEVAFARATGAGKQDRKCLLLLPLCPVYGLGALAILAVARWTGGAGWGLVLLGGGAATVVEYLMAVFYEKALGVSFWDYSDLPGDLHGRVSLTFSLVWGLLALVLVRWVHPGVAELVETIPLSVGVFMAVLVGVDSVCTVFLLRHTRSTDSLKWYQALLKRAAG